MTKIFIINFLKELMNVKNSPAHCLLLFFTKLILNLLNFQKDKHTEFKDLPLIHFVSWAFIF